MSSIWRIVYCSRSRLIGSRAEMEMQVRHILARARTANRAARITGALTFTETEFGQVLEGAEPDLRQVFARICHDPRHESVRVLDQSRVEARIFSHWSMAYVAAGEGRSMHPLAHFDFEPALIEGAAPQGVALLNALRQLVLANSAA